MKLKKWIACGLIAMLLPYTNVFAQNKSDNNKQTDVNSVVDIDKKINNLKNTMSAEAYVVMDSKTGEIILGKNEEKVMYPASLTKIMTSLLLLENKNMNDTITVSKKAASIGEASVYLAEGEVMTSKDLLYSMMLQSANDACYAVGEGISGTIENFYALMNSKAKQVGAVNSNFASPNGLHSEDHVSTAKDLALITKEALKYEEFRASLLAKEFTLTRTAEKGKRKISNLNRMLFENKPEYNKYSIGGKTAYTRQAGNCLMEVAKKDDMEIIVITMKSDNVYQDTSKLINFVFDNFNYQTIFSKDNIYEDYRGEMLQLYGEEDVVKMSVKSDNANIESASNFSVDISLNSLKEEISMGEKVGVAKIYEGKTLYKTVNLYSADNYILETPDIFKLMKNLILFTFILIGIKIIFNTIENKKRKRYTRLRKTDFY